MQHQIATGRTEHVKQYSSGLEHIQDLRRQFDLYTQAQHSPWVDSLTSSREGKEVTITSWFVSLNLPLDYADSTCIADFSLKTLLITY